MYRKNVAGQVLFFFLRNATTGAAVTGATVTVYMTKDGGSEGTPAGTVAEIGHGLYKLSLAQDDTNANVVGFVFTAAGALPVPILIQPTAADPTNGVNFGLSCLPDVAQGEAGSVALGDASGKVTLVSAIRPKKNTAIAKYMFPMTDSNTHQAAAGLTVVAERALDGGSFGACANPVVEMSAGVYRIDLAAGDLNGDTVFLKFTAAGADDRMVTIFTQP